MNEREKANEYLWGDFSPQDEPTYCTFALHFKKWADALCASVGVAIQQDGVGAVVAVNQAKVLLQDKYFEWRTIVPKAHKNRIGGTSSHLCIFDIWQATFMTLKALEVSLTPPLLLLPPAPPPSRVPKTSLSITDIVSFGSD